jgi:hypothetical protein
VLYIPYNITIPHFTCYTSSFTTENLGGMMQVWTRVTIRRRTLFRPSGKALRFHNVADRQGPGWGPPGPCRVHGDIQAYKSRPPSKAVHGRVVDAASMDLVSCQVRVYSPDFECDSVSLSMYRSEGRWGKRRYQHHLTTELSGPDTYDLAAVACEMSLAPRCGVAFGASEISWS